jgi:hypothetical protein
LNNKDKERNMNGNTETEQLFRIDYDCGKRTRLVFCLVMASDKDEAVSLFTARFRGNYRLYSIKPVAKEDNSGCLYRTPPRLLTARNVLRFLNREGR